MAKEWAKAFYNSPAWKKCRWTFMDTKHWTCERCSNPAQITHHKEYLTPLNINNPKVTLSWSNLEALCQDCHNKEHEVWGGKCSDIDNEIKFIDGKMVVEERELDDVLGGLFV